MQNAFTDFPQPPVLVIVGNGNWSSFSLSTVAISSDEALFAILETMGGVHESMPDGRYYFNAKYDEDLSTNTISLIVAPSVIEPPNWMIDEWNDAMARLRLVLNKPAEDLTMKDLLLEVEARLL
jgi:hypothetical protein